MSYPSLPVRLVIGIVFFSLAAALDLRRKGRDATRWREYAFLLACVVIAMVYGVFNDQITSSLSWEYFYYGKGLDVVLGPVTPPDTLALHWQAAKVGMMATWWVGLIAGVGLLIANNPLKDRPPLSYRSLLGRIRVIFGTAVLAALIGGLIGHAGGLNRLDSDINGLWQSNLWRPARFAAAWGVHLGGYVGGLLGLVAALIGVVRARMRARLESRSLP